MKYKKPIQITSIIIFVSVILLSIIPLLINGDGLKEQLENKISKKLEARFEVKGPVRVAIFPFPKIYLNEVEILNLNFGENYSNDLTSESIIIKTNFSSLFGEKLQIMDLIFQNPVIKTRASSLDEKEFQPNLTSFSSSHNILNKIFDFRNNDQIFDFRNIKHLNFVDGSFSQINSVGKNSIEFNEINFSFENDIKNQIMIAEGYFMSGEEPANFSLIANAANDKESLLKIESSIFNVTLEGKFSDSRIHDLIRSNFIGKADIEIVNLKSFLNKFVANDSQIFRKISAVKPIQIFTNIVGKEGKINLSDILVNSQLMSGAGKITADFSNIRTKINAAIDFENIDIDSIWSPTNAGNSNVSEAENSLVEDFITKTTFIQKNDNTSYLLDVNDSGLEDENFDDGFDFNAKITIKTAQYYGGDVSDIKLNFISSSGNILLNPLSANIPQKGSLLLNGIVDRKNKIPRFYGNIEINGEDLQEAMIWIGIDLNNIKKNILNKYDFKADLLLLPSFSIFNNLNLEINDNKNLITGIVKIDDSAGVSKITANMGMDYLKFDDYFKESNQDSYVSKGSLLKKVLWLNGIKYSQDIALNIEKLIIGDNEMDNSSLKIKFGQGYFKVSDLNFSSPKIDLSGSIDVDITKLPTLDISIISDILEYSDPVIAKRFFNFTDLGDFSGAMNFDIRRLKINDWNSGNIKIKGKNIAGIIDFEEFKLESYGGDIEFKGSMILKDLKTINGSVQLIEVDSGAVLSDIMGLNNISGLSNISATLNSSAFSKSEFIKKMDIKGEFVGSNISVGGFGIHDLSTKAFRPKINYLELLAPENILQRPESSSNLTNVTGSFMVSERSMGNQFSIKAGSAGINSVISGSFDIESGYIEGISDIIFISGTRKAQIPLRIAVSFKGKPGNIKQAGNLTQIRQYLNQRLGENYSPPESFVRDESESAEQNSQIGGGEQISY
jgi:hypothetical protein